jgi:hypothetical protein
MTPEQLVRRFPWSQYKDTPRPQFMTREEDHAFAVKNWVARVTWIVPSAARLDYGWRYETRTFDTVERALEVAALPMGVAKSVSVDRFNWEVPHNHKERAVQIYARKNAAYAKRKSA